MNEKVMTISCANPLTVLLENGSMFHNQTNADRPRKLSVHKFGLLLDATASV